MSSLVLENYDITSSQSLFLFVLYSNSNISASEIVEKIRSKLGNERVPTPGARYKIIQKLEEKRLIEETTNQENRKDKRKRTYKTTRAGNEMVKSQIQKMEAMFEFINDCCPGYFKNPKLIPTCEDGNC